MRLWVGVDAGKSAHHAVAMDEDGKVHLSRKVPNTEDDLLTLLGEVGRLADGEDVVWACDLNGGGAGLLIAILTAHAQTLLYIPGRTVYHAAASYRGDGKTDAKDARIIADQARMRRDLHPVRAGDPAATELRMLSAHRADLVADRTRAINRLRATLMEYFPSLEAAFDYSQRQAALTLLTKYATPDALRSAGVEKVTTWLKSQGCYASKRVATIAVEAADRQHTTVPGQDTAAMLVGRLAADALRLFEEVKEVESQLDARFRSHEHAELLLSLPGFGPTLAAEFIAATGGDMTLFGSPERLAAVAGLAPVPRDSGKISGNMRRPRRYDRRLLRACYMAANVAAQFCEISKAFYTRKRAEGKTHTQAVLALARRRINVIWAMLRDRTPYGQPAPTAALQAAT